jgi:hypothetical protein
MAISKNCMKGEYFTSIQTRKHKMAIRYGYFEVGTQVYTPLNHADKPQTRNSYFICTNSQLTDRIFASIRNREVGFKLFAPEFNSHSDTLATSYFRVIPQNSGGS